MSTESNATDTRHDKTRVRRIPDRGRYDRETIDAILDEALYCHVGFIDDGRPFVIPTIHVRVGDWLYLHGSAASRMLRVLAQGEPACITVTLLDGLVLARSAFHHSMNYRSVVFRSRGVLVADAAEKNRALEALVEHVIPGRSRDARMPNEKELRATWVVRFPLENASAKIRTGPPGDEEEDYKLPIWAGVIPLALTPGKAIDDGRLLDGVAMPEYAASYARRVG